MSDWKNFRKVKDWAVENADATDCSRLCATCKKTWAEIRNEGRGDEYVNMIDDTNKENPCGLPFKFLCDPCYENHLSSNSQT